ncbi:hypothetical protein B0H13DRAFT_2282461 [Mycena leptocephala]|nr:hypothetical protein B0H13DRAFT_2282461 [Mycena leptocephala]
MDEEQLVERNPSVVGQLKMREDSKAMVMKLRVSETMTATYYKVAFSSFQLAVHFSPLPTAVDWLFQSSRIPEPSTDRLSHGLVALACENLLSLSEHGDPVPGPGREKLTSERKGNINQTSFKLAKRRMINRAVGFEIGTKAGRQAWKWVGESVVEVDSRSRSSIVVMNPACKVLRCIVGVSSSNCNSNSECE